MDVPAAAQPEPRDRPPPAVATSEVIATEEAAPAGRAPAPAEEVVEEIYEE